MKRYVACLLILLLFVGSASAETLREQLVAPIHLQETWQGEDRILPVVIDAPIIMPDIEQAYVVDTAIHTYTVGEVEALGQAFFGKHVSVPNYSLIYSGHYDSYSTSIQMGEKHVGARYDVVKGIEISPSMSAQLSNLDYFMDITAIEEVTQFARCRYTYEQAYRIAADAVAQFAPDMVMIAYGANECIPYSAIQQGGVDRTMEFPEYPQGYVFCFAPAPNGMVQGYSFYSAGSSSPYAPHHPESRIMVGVTDDGLYGISCEGAETYGQMQEAELLSFAQIMDIAKAILPLTDVHLATYYRDTGAIAIDEIRLCWYRIKCRDNQQAYQLIPVWDFIGHKAVYENGTYRDMEGIPYMVKLTINAIDGTVIDRSYGY